MRTQFLAIALSLASLLPLAGCQSSGSAPKLEDWYLRSIRGSFAPSSRAERIEDIRERLADPELNPRERTFGALLLLDSSDVPVLEEAYVAAETANTAGFAAARPVMAQAIDRALYLQGHPQKYGTQYYREDDGSWQLYRIDETTTDAERHDFGVPTLAEAIHGVEVLNTGKPGK